MKLLPGDRPEEPLSSRVAWILFCGVSLQLAFLQPYVVVVPGERTNIFSGILCCIALIAALSSPARHTARWSRPEIVISVSLAVLAALSGILSDTPWLSSYRSFVLIASALGGFWCSRILLRSTERQKSFLWLCMAIFVVMVGLGLLGYVLDRQVNHLLDANPHPMANRLLILSFAPLAYLLEGGAAARIMALASVGLCYIVFFLSQLRSAVIIPVVACLIAFPMRLIRLKYLLAIVAIFIVIAPFFISRLPVTHLGKEYEPAYYRAESYPFSWHVATKHPFFGIGMRSPRDKYLEDYQIKYPYVTKEKFADSTDRVVTSENTFLTFISDVGMPFFLLYTVSLIILLTRLVRAVKEQPSDLYLPAAALLLPLVAALVHFQTFDGLMYPQLAWYFHALLGLVPVPAVRSQES